MWYVVTERENPDPEDRVWTVSEDPNKPGWETDQGFEAYGLTKEQAEFLVMAANAWQNADKD